MERIKTIRIALTKGRLEESATEIFEQIGLNCSELKDKGRKLVFNDYDNNIEFVLVKAPDVLTYVEHGAADIGIVGKDTLREMKKDFYEVLDLKVGRCKFSLASIPSFKLNEGFNRLKIATKYPNVAREYFREKGIDVEIIKIEGSVELAPILGLADAIVDIVETGTTLKENGLIIFEDICDISARMIVNRASMKLNKLRIEEIINKIKKYVEGV
ncbi:ATP phosphoribosyltransferase [Clostridium felsineum]|uniref:ATP phosphoribosyltransferase n=1 Tax=Clostridium felsineum TaxID=36839 RepID=UPI00214D159D|nr:ATP phosphoribosyltransferase [Clostridium felsineum]MCR3761706.1 ATP phosphoribosyltransferase [Clostridium felsineum]